MEATTYATLQTALGTGLTSLAGNLMSTAAVVIPVALTIWGAMLGVKYAKKFFAAISK